MYIQQTKWEKQTTYIDKEERKHWREKELEETVISVKAKQNQKKAKAYPMDG